MEETQGHSSIAAEYGTEERHTLPLMKSILTAKDGVEGLFDPRLLSKQHACGIKHE